MTKKHYLLLFSLALCFVFVGCSGDKKPAGLPQLYSISMTFTQEGEPCVGVAIVLLPLDESPWSASGLTDANGRTTFFTYGKYPGVPAGKFRIELSKYETDTDKDGNPLLYTLIDIDLPPIEIEVTGKDKFEPFDLGKKVRVLVKQ